MLGDSTHLERSFKRANAAAAGFNKSQTKTNKASKANQKVMRGVGSSVRLAGGAFLGGAGIVAGITSTLSKTAEFEKSLNTFQAVSKATSVQMKAIGAQAQQLGGDILLPGTSAKDAAEAMLELSKSGLSVTQVQKAVRSTLLLSAAAGVENARAAEIASNTLNAFNLDASKTPRVVDVLASAANASSIEIDDAALSFQQAGAIFSTFQGRTLGAEGAMKELAISVGLLGNAGIKGSDAGTSLKTALQRLASPVAKTKNLMRDLHLVTGGNEEAQRLFQLSIEGSSKKVRDLASNQLEKLQGSTKSGGDIAYDAAGRMRPFNEIIKNIAAATKGMTEEQKNWIVTQLGGSDASRALLILMRKQGTAYDTMSRAVNRSGSAADIAKAKQKGLAGAMDALKSAIETVQITLGTALAPALTKYLQSAARWVSDTNNQKTLMDSLRTTMASVGAVLRVIAAIFRGLSTVLGGNKNAVIFLIGAFVAFKALNMAATIAGMARNFGDDKGRCREQDVQPQHGRQGRIGRSGRSRRVRDHDDDSQADRARQETQGRRRDRLRRRRETRARQRSDREVRRQAQHRPGRSQAAPCDGGPVAAAGVVAERERRPADPPAPEPRRPRPPRVGWRDDWAGRPRERRCAARPGDDRARHDRGAEQGEETQHDPAPRTDQRQVGDNDAFTERSQRNKERTRGRGRARRRTLTGRPPSVDHTYRTEREGVAPGGDRPALLDRQPRRHNQTGGLNGIRSIPAR
jgi:TP901 family phage tail tape measure protein